MSLFQPETNTKYCIPKYQREYVWTIDQWGILFNDIMDSNEKELYLGTIITINSSGDSINPVLELIDGQQKMTTISLIFCALYNHSYYQKKSE